MDEQSVGSTISVDEQSLVACRNKSGMILVGSSEVITVLHAIKAPGDDTTYASQMRDSAPRGVATEFFTWHQAFRGTYDVIHLHWPEYLVRGGGGIDTLKSIIRIPRLLRKIQREKIAVVRTLHNMKPHEDGYFFERYLLNRLDALVERYIALNPVDHVADKPVITIPHGDYIERFGGHSRSDIIKGRLLYFGLVRPYKGIDVLAEIFHQVADPQLSLRIVGRPSSEQMRDLVNEAVRVDPARVSARQEFVSDSELVAEISAAEVIVLPYREMHNSGSLLVALSLGRPVLTVDTPVNRAIVEEIGPGWLWLYSGKLTEQILTDTRVAAAEAGSTRGGVPTFDSRDWSTVGRRHLEAYRSALAEKRHHTLGRET